MKKKINKWKYYTCVIEPPLSLQLKKDDMKISPPGWKEKVLELEKRGLAQLISCKDRNGLYDCYVLHDDWEENETK